ncbi:hypothetical protein ACG04Q_04100 [Roseateles sp. DXS20W]|uniref:HTH luxR-type domain-containing protein n=1 Tax=Pelomonas lactea TaxID=3299030 RepID=A0ABW7GFM6_9BURK
MLEAAGQQVVGKTPPLSPKSVDTYRSRLMKKLGINDIAGLVKWAIRGRSSWMTADGECP